MQIKNKKKAGQGKQRNEKQRNQTENNEMFDLNLNMSIITSHVNDINTSMKRHFKNRTNKTPKLMTQHVLHKRSSFQI